MTIGGPKTVQEALKGGVSFFCATCKRFWEGQARGLETCSTILPCGGPMARMTFPMYQGPVTDKSRYCFVCGDDKPMGGVKVPGEEQILGVCKKHVYMLMTLKPDHSKPVQQKSILTNEPLRLIHRSVERAAPLPPKSLTQVIQETEAEWAAEDAYKAEERAKKCGR